MSERVFEEVAVGEQAAHHQAHAPEQPLQESVLEAMHREHGNSYVMRVIASSLNVRSTPDSHATGNIIGTLPHGAEVVTTGDAGAWKSIQHPRGKAFVHGDYLSASAPPKAE